MSNLGPHTDNNFEYGDEFGRIAGVAGRLAAITCIMNPNDLGKAAPAINAAVNQALRFHNVETNMSGTDQGQFTAQQNVTTAINAIKPALALYPNARWAYFRNELGDWSKADFYAEEMRLWVEGLAALGYYAGIGCFSFGTPDYALWAKFDPALAAANANGGAVLLHEYGVLTMKSQYDASTGRGHHCLRYRNVWAQNNYPSRFKNLMWWITETGLDKDVNTNTGGGWKASGVTAQQYLDDLNWYDNEISKDGVSATVYQWGREPRWADYDIQGPVVDSLLAHIGNGMPNLKAGGVVQPPVDPPPVDPPPPTPPSTVTLYDMAFTGYNHVFDVGDKYGDRWIPTDNNGNPQFYYRWTTPSDGKIAHVEPYPPANTGFDAPYALRIQNQSAIKQEFWLWMDFETVPGDTIKVTLESAPEIVGGNGTVTRAIVIDPSGNSDARVPGLPYAETTAPTKAGITLTAIATGPLTTVMVLVKWKIPLRVNLDITRLRVERTRGTPPPDPDPIPQPGAYVTTGAVNIRPQPNTVAARVGEFLAGKDVPIAEFVKGEVWNGNPYWGKIAAGLFVSAYYLRSK